MASTSGAFEITLWDQAPFDEAEGAVLSRARVEKVFSGGLEGTSAAELLMAVAPGGAAVYSAVERVEGRLGGREGGFVLHHGARTWAGPQDEVAAEVVPGSGRGGLAGLTGTMAIRHHDDGSHTWTMEYEL
jgi:Protein of unknown function (DUF3224)